MRNKKTIALLLIFFIPLFTVCIFPQRSIGAQNIFVKAGDLIKNFQVKSINGIPYSSSGKLKAEYGSVWKIEQSNVQLIQAYMTPNNEVILNYKIGLTNTFNFYSDVSLSQGCKSLGLIAEPFSAAYYTHHGCTGAHMYHWDANITWSHYNFYSGTDIRTFNDANNLFRGNIDFTFDIAGNLLPSSISSEVASLNKTFDYIALSSATCTKNTKFDLSKGEINIAGLTPKQYETTSPTTTAGFTEGKTATTIRWNPNINLIPNVAYESWDGGVQGHTVGTGMNPTTKDGRPIWDPQEQRSMVDGKISYALGAVSPLIKKYTGLMSYDYQYVKTSDYLEWFTWKVKVTYNTPQRYTYYRDTALNVLNRGVQSEVIMWFDVYSSYSIETKVTGEVVQVEIPERWFDDLTWLTIVEGFGGGEQYTAAPPSWDPFGLLGDIFSNIWTWIIIFIILIVTIAIVWYVVIPMLRTRAKGKQITSRGRSGATTKAKSGKGMSPLTIAIGLVIFIVVVGVVIGTFA